MEPQPVLPHSTNAPSKRIAVLCIAALALVMMVGAWLYVDAMRKDLESKIQALEARQATPSLPDAKTETKEGWYAYQNAQLGFSLMVPDTHRVIDSGDHILIVLKPTSMNETPVPDMVVRVTPTASAVQYPGTMIQKGDKTYWLYTWENFDWPPSAEVIASFKTL